MIFSLLTNWRVLAALALTAASAFFTLKAIAHDYAAGALRIDHPWAPPTMTARVPAAAYFDIRNDGNTDDRLVAASTDRAAHVELHASFKDAQTGVMKMRVARNGVPARAGDTLSMEGGSYHVMLIGLDAPLTAGEAFAMTLTFEKAGEVEVIVKVEDRKPGGGHKDRHGGH